MFYKNVFRSADPEYLQEIIIEVKFMIVKRWSNLPVA